MCHLNLSCILILRYIWYITYTKFYTYKYHKLLEFLICFCQRQCKRDRVYPQIHSKHKLSIKHIFDYHFITKGIKIVKSITIPLGHPDFICLLTAFRAVVPSRLHAERIIFSFWPSTLGKESGSSQCFKVKSCTR